MSAILIFIVLANVLSKHGNAQSPPEYNSGHADELKNTLLRRSNEVLRVDGKSEREIHSPQSLSDILDIFEIQPGQLKDTANIPSLMKIMPDNILSQRRDMGNTIHRLVNQGLLTFFIHIVLYYFYTTNTPFNVHLACIIAGFSAFFVLLQDLVTFLPPSHILYDPFSILNFKK